MAIVPPEHSLNLVADVGGTNVRFALSNAPLAYEKVAVYKTSTFSSLAGALGHYLQAQGNPAIRHCVVGIANPVVGDHVKMTNTPWQFSIEQTRAALGFENLFIINDFTALALAIPFLPSAELVSVGEGESIQGAPVGVLGPGTGLGVSALIPKEKGGWIPLASEGGHASFAPSSERELMLWHAAKLQFGHVSMERLVSGAGLQFIYQTLSRLDGEDPQAYSPAEISRHAIDNTCVYSREALDTFCAILGTAAANIALTFGARGGVYLGGGIIPRLGGYFLESPFRERFEHKGRFSGYLSSIPVFVITSKHPGLLGAAAYLKQTSGAL